MIALAEALLESQAKTNCVLCENVSYTDETRDERFRKFYEEGQP